MTSGVAALTDAADRDRHGRWKRTLPVAGSRATRASFSEVYPTWPGKSVYINMDAGLIQIFRGRRIRMGRRLASEDSRSYAF